MSGSVDELTIEYFEDGTKTVDELDKVVLTKGAWATLIYRYRDLDRKNDCWGKEKYSIRRYQKRNNEYTQKSKFNISSKDQARKIIEALTTWVELPEEG